jgi:cullin-associated NEDD8-dissociated protein 1
MGTEGAVTTQDDPQLRVWCQYWDWMAKEHVVALKMVSDEIKERDR